MPQYLVSPDWSTYDGFVPQYPLPSNRPDPELIGAIDAAAIPGVSSMQRYGMAIDIPYTHDLTLKIDKKIDELKTQILDYIPKEAFAKFDTSDAAEAEAYDTISNIEVDGIPAALTGLVTDPVSLENVTGKNERVEIKHQLDNYLNIDSPTQLAALLFQTLEVGQGRILKRSKSSGKISTDKEQLNNLKSEHPVIPLLLDYRAHMKAKGTYTAKLPQIAVLHPKSINSACTVCGRRHYENVWRVHTSILMTRAATGRLASKAPNLQNIPARTELGRMIRMAFIPEVGYVLLDADLSQAELRLLAHRAREERMLETYRLGEDIHIKTAMYAFNITDPKLVDKQLHRAPCKNVNFGIVYGLTGEGLFDQMVLTYATAGKPLPDWLTLTWCEKFIETWYSIYPQVRDYLSLEHNRALDYGLVWTEYGRHRLIPEVYSVLQHIVQAGLRQAGNMPIQGTCADIVRIIIRVLEDYFGHYQPRVLRLPASKQSFNLMSIHDEQIVESPEDKAEDNKTAMIQLMTGVTQSWMRIELPADGKTLKRLEKD